MSSLLEAPLDWQNFLEFRNANQCSHYADFFQRIGDLFEQGQIIFGNIVNIALENSTNL